jgi:acetyl esterase/lipase
MDAKGSSEFTITTDIPYLGDDRKERMDAYLPQGASSAPVPGVILVHGGGWTEGSRRREREVAFATSLARKGFGVFSIDYALGAWSGRPFESRLERSAWPQCLYDCKAAVRHVRTHATRYGVRPDRLALAGGSAGAHLAMMAALTSHGSGAADSSFVDCIVVSRGIFDMDQRLSRWLIDEAEAGNPLVLNAASPLNFVGPRTPPMLAFHGSEDRISDPAKARAMAARLKQFGVEHRLVLVPGKGHELRLDAPESNHMMIVETFLRWNLLCR